LLAGAALAGLSLCGCATFWDDVTSRDRDYRALFIKPDPLVVLRDSKDGDKRARAYLALKEPKPSGGTDREQDQVLELLAVASRTEPQFYPRLMAVQKLGEFKDPRAAQVLIDAYSTAHPFPADKVTMLRCQALTGLGEVGHPSAVDFLARVVRQPPAVGSADERQLVMDERLAAARALGHFPQYQATEALVRVLQAEKEDVALRTCAHESLQASTGKDLPMDGKAWEDLLHKQPRDGVAEPKKGFMDTILTSFQR
jgi:hypothetical protein